MTNQEIADMMFTKLQGAKLIGVSPNQGAEPAFTLSFENEKEERATLTFRPSLQTQATSGVVEIRSRIEINVADWRK